MLECKGLRLVSGRCSSRLAVIPNVMWIHICVKCSALPPNTAELKNIKTLHWDWADWGKSLRDTCQRDIEHIRKINPFSWYHSSIFNQLLVVSSYITAIAICEFCLSLPLRFESDISSRHGQAVSIPRRRWLLFWVCLHGKSRWTVGDLYTEE